MFKRFFAALASLTANAEALAASFAEANENFRHNLALDHKEDVPAIDHTEEDRPARSNGKRAGAR